MRRPYEARGVVALGLEAREEVLVSHFVHQWGARQNPQVVATGVPHHGVSVVIGEFDNPVLTPEGAEERDFEFRIGGAVHQARFPERQLFLAVYRSLATAVEHVDVPVRAQGIGSRGGRAPALKILGEARYLVPSSEVAREFDVLDRLERRKTQSLRRGGTASKHQSDNPSSHGQSLFRGHCTVFRAVSWKDASPSRCAQGDFK